MERGEVVFIPSPGAGHLASAVEIAKLLIQRDERLSITLIIMELPIKRTPVQNPKLTTSDSSSSSSADSRLRFVDLPYDESKVAPISTKSFLAPFLESQKPRVRDIVSDINTTNRRSVVGFVVDMFCSGMIDVANEFQVPTYIYFTSSAATLGLMFHLQALRDQHNHDVTELKDDLETELSMPCYAVPLPAKVLPSVAFDKDGGSKTFLDLAVRFREAKGVIINTFIELESHAVESLCRGDTPPVYTVGPIIHFNGNDTGKDDDVNDIMKWLDEQPESSVVFLCFGSMGSFDEEQVKEITVALERSGQRFLWSLRRPPPKGVMMTPPSDYDNPEEVLPEGFLERTAGIGKVIGWAPQMAVLSHPSVGGFVSHCGWNSTLESIWCGVPIATWPIYAEQQLNAFQMVKELGLAVEIKMDYRNDFKIKSEPVTSEQIENGIRCLMADNHHRNEMRKRVNAMQEKCRISVSEGGSSYTSLGRFIEDILAKA